MWGWMSSFMKRFRLKIDTQPLDLFLGFGAFAGIAFFFGSDGLFLRRTRTACFLERGMSRSRAMTTWRRRACSADRTATDRRRTFADGAAGRGGVGANSAHTLGGKLRAFATSGGPSVADRATKAPAGQRGVDRIAVLLSQ